MARSLASYMPDVSRRAATAIAFGLSALLVDPALAIVDVRIGSCTVTVVSPGVLTPSTDLKTLSTLNAGGRPAQVRISTLINGTFPHTTCSLLAQVNCFRVTATPPTSFSTKPFNDDASSVSFNAGWRETGGSSLLNLLSAVILNGDRNLEMHLTAVKARGTFAAGRYDTDETIRCE